MKNEGIQPKGRALLPLERMELMISLIPYLKERRFIGDYRASDAVQDIEDAISRAVLTERQREVVETVMFGGVTYREASTRLGVHFTTLAEHGRLALEKIIAEYERGERDDA